MVEQVCRTMDFKESIVIQVCRTMDSKESMVIQVCRVMDSTESMIIQVCRGMDSIESMVILPRIFNFYQTTYNLHFITKTKFKNAYQEITYNG
jgi:hypothetical protein